MAGLLCPNVIPSRAVPRLPQRVLGQPETRALRLIDNPLVTFEQNICCSTSLPDPFCRSQLKKQETVSLANQTPTPDWLFPSLTKSSANIPWNLMKGKTVKEVIHPSDICCSTIIFSILKIQCECWRGWDAINKVSVTWIGAAINLLHLPVSPSLCFSLCFHISMSLPLRPTSPSSLSNSI